MFHIGGEQELEKKHYYREITNSGRSSLRLIIQSAELQGKHLLLPNFLCEVILDVLLEYDVKIDFYDVGSDFEFELPKKINNYDCLYLIKYFGMANMSFQNAVSRFSKCLIIDDVFSPYPHVLERGTLWFSYNSLRKISPVADLSLLYSNQPIHKVEPKILPLFSDLKYKAKGLKSTFLGGGHGHESEYLNLFQEAEQVLDASRGIYSASNASLFEAIEFYRKLDFETKIRKENYLLLKSCLGDLVMNVNTKFYSFLPLLLQNRNTIKKKLMLDNIFLAIHWPENNKVSNKISNKILSIPLDSRYDKKDIEKLCDTLKKICDVQYD
ncbi:pyridoxal phosphate-dependent transferase [Psychromonas hadalis]|uniref:pyridoxal phosphate-dependent transferase n=1 Tax=Psychromonas hadalis TaxID=211669 RepID=UPI0003B669A2|nr:pyridoxal phosphate-dependent transferase [Psychromonas hadalis]